MFIRNTIYSVIYKYIAYARRAAYVVSSFGRDKISLYLPPLERLVQAQAAACRNIRNVSETCGNILKSTRSN